MLPGFLEEVSCDMKQCFRLMPLLSFYYLSENSYAIKTQGETSGAIEKTKGLRQGNAVACLLFIVALEKVVRGAELEARGTIFYKSMQILRMMLIS